MERVREAPFANVSDTFPGLMWLSSPIQDVTANTEAAQRRESSGKPREV